MSSMDNFLQSKTFKEITVVVAGLVVLALVFGVGVFVGAKKAEFSFRWADEYHRNFGGPQGGFFNDFMGMGGQFTAPNGVFGQIVKINDESLTVKDKDNVEKIILVNDKTPITYQRQNMKLSELKVGDSVVIIGEPNSNGQIKAGLIRVIPPAPSDRPSESLNQ